MKDVAVFKDTRLLEALDYIDRDLIAEVIDDIKVPDADAVPGKSKKAVWSTTKQFLMLAACIMLISAFIPMMSYVIEHYDISLGGIFGHDTTSETNADNTEEHAENPSYPIFTPDLEPISDEMIAELKEVWYQKIYNFEYAVSLKFYEDKKNTIDQEKASVQNAECIANDYTSILFSTKKEDHFQGRYYGTISDCVIFAINTYLKDQYNVITLGRTSIVNDYSIHIFAYKDGVIKTIETAYSDGWLNVADAEKIKERHDKFNAYGFWETDEKLVYGYTKFVSDLEDISERKIEQINIELYNEVYDRTFEFRLNENKNIYKDLYSNRRLKENAARSAYSYAQSSLKVLVIDDLFGELCRYYGTFGNCIIWAHPGAADMYIYDLNGLKIRLPSGFCIKVYRNGEFFDLQEAFDEGILDIDNACKLYHRYLTYEEYLASDRTAPIPAFSEDKSAEAIYKQAKSGNFVVFNDAFVTAGEDIWSSFYEKCSNGQPAAVNIVNYYPSRSAIYLTKIIYNNGQFEQYTEARSGGYTNFLYSKYNHIIKYDGEPIDPESAIHRREEVYILVNDDTLTYPKIKESTESLNYYIAFTKISDIKDEYTTLIPRE